MDTDTFTVFYCKHHDAGVVIQGNHPDSDGDEFIELCCGGCVINHPCCMENYGAVTATNTNDCRAAQNYDRSSMWNLHYYLSEVYTRNGARIENLPDWLIRYFGWRDD